MSSRPKIITLLAVLTLVGGACKGGPSSNPSPTPQKPQFQKGGTLRVGIYSWDPTGPIDPTTSFGEPFGVWQCCMRRMLYSFTGTTTAEGGSVLHPDLAAGGPEVSQDAMTWTFRLKPGLHYAPPLQDEEITAADIVRAVERVLTPAPKAIQEWSGPFLGAGYQQYFLPIHGAPDYLAGKAETISGLEVLDPHTLRVRLTQAIGDLDYRFSLFVTSPIAPNPFRPQDELGIAEGHEMDGYERVAVSTGPYMFEGSERIDFSKSPAEQEPPSGYRTLTLIRNPSWNAASDRLRPAYVDRMEFLIFDSKPHTVSKVASAASFARTPDYQKEFADKLDSGLIDFTIDIPSPAEQVLRYRADPALRGRVKSYVVGSIRSFTFNLALPPFDDVHVRKAINLVLDKQRILEARQTFGGPGLAAIYSHLAPDRQENNLLASYDPYATPGHRGDPETASKEMALSPYDTDHDGRCDGPPCTISIPWREDGGYKGIAEIVTDNLAEIGLHLKVTLGPAGAMFSDCADPATHTTFCQLGWVGDYPSASTYFPPLFSKDAIGSFNFTLTGATSEQLRKWKYPVQSVPDLDARMADCSVKVGADQVQCWAAFDQYMMEVIVPAAPVLTDTAVKTFSARLAHFTFDEVNFVVGLANIALKPAI